MASIQKLKCGYRIKWREGGRGSKEKTVTLRDATKAQALEEEARIEALIRSRKPLRSGELLTLEDVLHRWERSRLSGTRPNDAHSTAKSVTRARRHFARMGWRTVLDITPAEVQRWRDETRRSLRAGSVIRAILWWAKDFAEQPVDERVLVAFRPPPDEGRPPRPLPAPDLVASAVQAAKKISASTGMMMHCLSVYGWRASAVARARVGDLREHGMVVRTKGRRGHREQLVALLPETLAGLCRLTAGRKPDDPLFLDPRTGEAWPEHGSQSIPEFTRRTLGIRANDVKFHAVTSLLDVLEPHEARDLTTHKTLSQLYRYARSNRERGDRVIAKLQAAAQSHHVARRRTSAPETPTRTPRSRGKTRTHGHRRTTANRAPRT